VHPLELRGWLFDLDGVLTDTARVHVEAWKETFDELLEQITSSGGPEERDSEKIEESGKLVEAQEVEEPGEAQEPKASAEAGKIGMAETSGVAEKSGAAQKSRDPGRPFDPVTDYERYVDGRSRADGVKAFLASRGIVLPEGTHDDPPDRRTVWGVGNKKNARFLRLLDQGGVEVFPASAQLVRALVATGRCTGVVSASENCRAVLDAGGLSGLFWVVVDGVVALEHRLAGKPAPDTYLYGAELLGLEPALVAVVEDAPAGVAAGRAGRFGYVVGIARRATPEELLEAGADVVVRDLEEFAELIHTLTQWEHPGG
jgi:HAD superfamily hydrolase (TIGR01509 family)